MVGEKAPTKKKFSKLGEIRRPLIISSFIAAIAISGITGGIYIFNILQQDKEVMITLDMDWFLNSFDPLYNPDDLCFRSNALIWDQLAEGLFEHNQSREDTPIIPCLAEDLGDWSQDGLNFTVKLKEGIKFHDDTPFNATTVKWNFDRINKFIDIKPHSDNWVWAYMYEWPDGTKRINETLVIDEYTVRFILNRPYVPLRALLATWQSYILSPSSTPTNDYVDKFSGKLIGTGPFVLESYDMDPVFELCGNVTLIVNKDYWELKPKIDKIHIEHFSEDEAMEKFLTGELHYTRMRQDYNRTILEVYNDTVEINTFPIISGGIFSVCTNNDIFPLEMRKAMSYAFNYSDYNKMMYDDRYVRCKSPLSKGMLYSNWNLNVSYTDIKIARQTLINAAWPGTSNLTANYNISVGNEWEKLVDDGTPLETYNYSIEEGRESHIFQASLLTKYFKQIGLKIELVNLTPQEWWQKLINGELEFYTSGWGPAFNDPVEMLDPLYLEYADFNYYNFSDVEVETWLDEGLTEINETLRADIYLNIQKRLIEVLYPVIWTFSPVEWEIWASSVKGIPLEGANFKTMLKYAYVEET